MSGMALRFQFNERKGTEALAYMAEKWPNITIFYASKVLFFAEKKHLNTYGRPIVADTFIAMPNGPVPSTLYDFIKGNLANAGDPDGFRGAIDTSNHPRLVAKREFDPTVLSETDIECINDAIEFCRSKSFGHLSDLTHREKAWAEAYANSAMDYEMFVDDENPNREAILEDAKEFAAYGVLQVPFEAGHLYWITFGFIQPPHEKISLCVCPERPLFFWINSNPKPHGIGQVLVTAEICPTLNYDSVLDLSGTKTGPEADLNTARHAGPISAELRALVVAELSNPIRLLPDAHRVLALGNLA